ncbi:MAP kinase-activating death domain-containing protein [Loa loa]|uniref:MAP kinase-activating death domain protein n=1 Tax=Loa loa TaxID=7209 RepID=A0A1I7VI39_LOALO|nr:MAP kinase-activating death domain-containing protein [Loa loa]EJD73703.1 MAP kinase-activating death domain-containing protein [Loa loa]
MDDKGKELCPRLIDYLVIVGRRRGKYISQTSIGDASSSSSISQSITTPELLRRYPNNDHKDFYLPTDVTVFCQPEGCVTKEVPRHSLSHRETSSFVFTLTEKDSAKIRYGICLNFLQSYEKNRAVSTDDKGILCSNRPHKRLDQRLSLTSLCLISHHPFLSTFRELLLLLKKLIDGCSQRLIDDGQYSKDIIWAALTGCWTEPIPPRVMQNIRELETWILMLLSAPVSVPGKTKVLLEVLPSNILPIFEFALPDHTRFSFVDFPLHLPLELLGIDTAMKVMAAIMLESKVVLQSRNYNAVSMCVLALVALMYPLEYMFPVIPLLPSFMPSAEQLLYAPTPFVIGVPASFFAHKAIDIPNDIIVVDLDTNQLLIPDDINIPDMPEPDCTELKNSLRKSLDQLLLNIPGMESGNDETVETDYTLDSDVVDISVRVAMIRFFNSANVFANFCEHTRTLRLYPRPVVALQTESFLRSRPQFTQFIAELCKTQAVEYFAECSLCPHNETYVRVQAGTDDPKQIGDKGKWFNESLMPIHFTVYSNDSTLVDAWRNVAEEWRNSVTDSNGDEVSDAGNTDGESFSSIDDLLFDIADQTETSVGAAKPLGEVDDVYKEPLTLAIPRSESVHSAGSSTSSGQSTPSSSISTSAMDSEADFARLAENLALKSDSRGDFSFHPPNESTAVTDCQSSAFRRLSSQSGSSTNATISKAPPSKGTAIKGLAHLADSGEKVLGPQFMSALNGYAERSHDMLNQVLHRTAPKAQAIRDKAVRPIALAAANRVEQSQHLVRTKSSIIGNKSTNAAAQQSKNQQTVREICDQILAGQGVGVFTYPKLKRLMEDESLRQLVCSKLNLGLDVQHFEDDFIQDMQLTRNQYKGYLKALQTCIAGLEYSYNSSGSNGLASLFHVLEIAHSHYWTKETEVTSPASASGSLLNTPSSSLYDVQRQQHEILSPLRPPPIPIGPPLSLPLPGSQAPKPPIPPRISHEIVLPTGPPPPLPPRPVVVRQNVCDDARSVSKSNVQPKNLEEVAKANSISSDTKKSESKLNLDNKTETSSTISERSSFTSTIKSRLHVQPPDSLSFDSTTSSRVSSDIKPIRHFIYQDLILPSPNPLWQKMGFWENAFFDVVAQERDIIGMDQEPCEMIDRYCSLSESEKRRLELDEDHLLSTLLHNLTSYMIMCGGGQRTVQQKIRRLLGKAHIGLVYSKTINQLLDDLPKTQSNGIPLKPLGSRLIQKQSFTVHEGATAQDPLMFMEVCDDAVVLRAVTGAITERWWYERVVNMTYSPKTRVLCLWRRHEGKVHMHKFYTRKCRELYTAMKEAMERAAIRGKVTLSGRDLGGEFPVQDMESNQGGLLQVRIDGITLLFEERQHFVELSNIKKCNTFGGNVFVLEEYDRKKNELIQRRYLSQMADQICYAVLCVFSIVAAGRRTSDMNKRSMKFPKNKLSLTHFSLKPEP